MHERITKVYFLPTCDGEEKSGEEQKLRRGAHFCHDRRNRNLSLAFNDDYDALNNNCTAAGFL